MHALAQVLKGLQSCSNTTDTVYAWLEEDAWGRLMVIFRVSSRIGLGNEQPDSKNNVHLNNMAKSSIIPFRN